MTRNGTQRRGTDRSGGTAHDAMGPVVPQVGDDMAVDLALSVLTAARVGHLLVCDADGRCTGLVSRAQLVAHRGGAWYEDFTSLRDIPHDRGPFIPSASSLHDAEHAMRGSTRSASPVVDGDGYAMGVLALPG